MTTVILIVCMIVLVGGVSYLVGASKYDRRLREMDRDIIGRDIYLKDLEEEASRLAVLQAGRKPVEGKKMIQTPSAMLNCLMCHDLEQTRSFHFVERIMDIQDAKGLRRRICTNCHGPPEDPSTAIPDPSKPYPSDDSHPHRVHQAKLDANAITCGACHEYKGEFRYPKPKEGQLLVCELCHANGNFITLHIDGQILKDGEVDPVWIKEGDKHKCQECHWGDVVDIHKRATADLGQY